MNKVNTVPEDVTWTKVTEVEGRSEDEMRWEFELGLRYGGRTQETGRG